MPSMRIRFNDEQKKRATVIFIVLFVLITIGLICISRKTPPGNISNVVSRKARVRTASLHRTNDCSKKVVWEDMTESIELATNYMINAQTEEGNFIYEVDWKTGELTDDDNDVRQAGAFFGLALAFNDKPTSEVASAWRTARVYWQRHSKESIVGPGRFMKYPTKGKAMPALACTTLAAMGYIDFLRTPESHDDPDWPIYKSELDELLKFLIYSMNDHTYLVPSYVKDNGEATINANPYGNGEFLLCIIKATKYLGYPYATLAHNNALSGFEEWISGPLAENDDPDETKGYYQWSSMSWYELTTSTEFYSPTEEQVLNYRRWLVKMGYWIIDKHRILRRKRNTGYAYEGIIHAREAALALKTQEGDKAARYFAQTAHTGICGLMQWQVGNRYQNDFVKGAKNDPNYLGGVQNHASEPLLRIDTTQHQLHTYILFLRYIA
ncbi:hypothetical protein SARC_01879 [Sphaeroforma arctica JP610]|uniref:Alginate lyase domain-containing protein n=1 Tax=Sphaeroforma arctica JP610 TaxID=667725 RepID=A0A0L0GA72_9EUKA|nr:hypothetical protein SARC_01879 [Sphaeroforma arctica JP610]KNC85932.1 hypothetical protein SARC_01879 [Sphaeroforma arctica JP610]|eukprot:XP_014159834.1 hypothetical protein SARC_01879 [Sphaeroforma arctica JP610]